MADAFDPVWAALTSRWMAGDPFKPSDPIRQYYAVKWRIAQRISPSRILEIGVRAGYSAFTFLMASPRGTRYLGIDSGLCDAEGRSEFLAHAKTILAEHDARLWRVDAGSLRSFPVGPGGDSWELVHIDGDHSYEGCLHDLRCAGKVGRRLLVDDYDVGEGIRQACRDFLASEPHGLWSTQEIGDGGVAGNLFLSRTGSV